MWALDCNKNTALTRQGVIEFLGRRAMICDVNNTIMEFLDANTLISTKKMLSKNSTASKHTVFLLCDSLVKSSTLFFLNPCEGKKCSNHQDINKIIELKIKTNIIMFCKFE
jgi:hypothetical protein